MYLKKNEGGRFARIILDRWFKRTFGEESRKRLLLLFLEALIPERKIANLTYVNGEHINMFPEGHKGIIDVECVDENGARFMVEMQIHKQESFYDRAVLYSSFGIQQQVLAGSGDDYRMRPLYFIGLMDFSMHRGSDEVLFRYSIQNDDGSGERMTENLHFIFLELPNCSKALTPEAGILDNFCYALHNMENLPERPKELKGEIFKLLFDSAEISSFAVDEQKNYEEDMTTERDLRNQLAYAKKEGREEGIAVGVAKGRADGITEGIARGKTEEKTEIARKLLAEGMDKNFVSKTCGLSIDELKSLMK